jgi:hypothetical protein
MATGRETLEVPLIAYISVAEADHCALRIIPEACFQKG